MLLRVKTDNKGGNVDDLLPNSVLSIRKWTMPSSTDAPNMPLPNQNASVVDRFGQATLEYLSLESSFQEIFDLEGKHVIKTHTTLIQHTNSN